MIAVLLIKYFFTCFASTSGVREIVRSNKLAIAKIKIDAFSRNTDVQLTNNETVNEISSKNEALALNLPFVRVSFQDTFKLSN